MKRGTHERCALAHISRVIGGAEVIYVAGRLSRLLDPYSGLKNSANNLRWSRESSQRFLPPRERGRRIAPLFRETRVVEEQIRILRKTFDSSAKNRFRLVEAAQVSQSAGVFDVTSGKKFSEVDAAIADRNDRGHTKNSPDHRAGATAVNINRDLCCAQTLQAPHLRRRAHEK
jgi:hypothetical protein